jgi:RimJ/RimL family protein N-acetyltransferase
MIDIASERLVIREITEDDLAVILSVLMSDPEHLRRQEGSEGEPGRYDMERWQRDWSIGQMMPGRHMLGCYLKASQEAIGYVEFMEEVDDGMPWFGMLLIHMQYRRQGFGSEAFQRLMMLFRTEYQWPLLRAWVATANDAGYAFAHHVGFHIVDKKMMRFAGGMQEIVQLEYSL